MINKKNTRYDQIEISDDQLLKAVENGIKRGKIYKLKKRILKITLSAALFGFVISNSDYFYTQAIKLPVIGDFVKAIHIGKGGNELVNGEISVISSGSTIEISYLKDKVVQDNVKPYIIDYKVAPYRINISLKDISEKEFKSFKKEFMNINGVSDVYLVPAKEKGYISFNVVLKKLYNYEVMEFNNPGKIYINFFENAYYTKGDIHPEKRVYLIETKEYNNILEINDFHDLYKIKEASVVKTKDGKYILVIGEYNTLEEAKKIFEEIKGKYSDVQFKIKKVNAMDSL